MEYHLIYLIHSVTSKLKKLVAQEAMCDCEFSKKWEEQSNLKQLFYSLSNYQLQFTWIISLQFKFLPGRCELNCSWTLIAALFHKSTFFAKHYRSSTV